jgi:exopolysaccharide biosynthesis polyprenyl glycosylphosphotransferase
MSVDVGPQEVQTMPAGAVRFYAEARSNAGARRIPRWWLVAPLVMLDTLSIVLSMLGAYLLRFRVMEYYATFSSDFYVRLGGIAVLTWWIIFAAYNLYRTEYLFGGVQEYGGVINACTMGLMGLVLYSFLDRSNNHDISRGWLAMVWVFSITSVGLTRFGYRRVIYALRQRGLLIRQAIVVGANEEGQQVAAQLRSAPRAGLQVVGFVDPDLAPGKSVGGLPVLGDLGSLGSLIRRFGVEELIVVPTALDRERLLDVYRDYGNNGDLDIRLSSGLYELFNTGVRVKEIGFVPFVSLNRTRITGVDAMLKSVLDYLIALVALVMLSPVLLFIILLIRRDSPGRAIYRRRVVGLHGQTFDAFKFRTMMENAEAYLEAHPELKKEWDETGKVRDDPRITRVGRFLRRSSLDELPQLLNVLRGEMSLVGPRMITPEELRHFGRWRHNLLTVRPGMTGLWQVSGRSDISYEERVRLDMHYIRNHTMWLDIRLLLNTVTAVLAGRGAC